MNKNAKKNISLNSNPNHMITLYVNECRDINRCIPLCNIPSEFDINGYDEADIVKIYEEIIEEFILKNSDYGRNMHTLVIRKFNELIINYVDNMNEYSESSLSYSNHNGGSFKNSFLSMFHSPNHYYELKSKIVDSFYGYEEIGDPVSGEAQKIFESLRQIYLSIYDPINCNRNVPCYYDLKLVEGYLSNFFNFFQRCIFNRKNLILNVDNFRRSQTLSILSALEMLPEGDSGKYHFFSMYAPFTLASIQRTLDNICNLKEKIDLSNSNDLLIQFRKELFLRKASRILTRHSRIGNSTQRIVLSRHLSQLIGIKYDQMSSIEDVKPIRLFEKIATAISKKSNQLEICDGILAVNVAIVGHIEFPDTVITSYNAESEEYEVDNLLSEISDLASAILCWYKDNASVFCHSLKLTINQYINADINGEDSNANSKMNKVTYKMYTDRSKCEQKCKVDTKLDNQVVFTLHRVCYSDIQYDISPKPIDELIANNDVLFLIDCPWLVSEQYDFEQYEYFSGFSKRLENMTYISDYKMNKLGESMESIGIMQTLDSQYNRIVSSETICSGMVARVPREYILSHINDRMRGLINDSNKTVYVYYSTRFGLSKSAYSNYPISRKERYGGKDVTILKFTSNISNNTIALENSSAKKPITIRLRLWSLLKYIEIAIAYKEVRTYCEKVINTAISNVAKLITNPRDLKVIKAFKLQSHHYFHIYNNIYFKIEYGSNTSVTITPHYNNQLLNFVNDMFGYNLVENDIGLFNNDLIEILKKEILSGLSAFASNFKTLFTDVFFSAKKGFGNDCMKDAFEMITYSSAEYVEDMLFLYIYRSLRREIRDGSFMQINTDYWGDLTIDKSMNCDVDERTLFLKDSFMDKKVYENIMLFIERGRDTDLNIDTLLNKWVEIFGQKKSKVFENIKKACDRCGYPTQKFKENLFKILDCSK